MRLFGFYLDGLLCWFLAIFYQLMSAIVWFFNRSVSFFPFLPIYSWLIFLPYFAIIRLACYIQFFPFRGVVRFGLFFVSVIIDPFLTNLSGSYLERYCKHNMNQYLPLFLYRILLTSVFPACLLAFSHVHIWN